MATTTAKTKKDVDEMTSEERLWDSLNYSYGKKGEQLSSEYNKAISQQDRALLGRGMQRSSAGMSTLGGLRNQKVKALDDNNSQLIADYENRLQTLREAEEARKFQTSEREAQQAWQSGENELARAFQTSEREAQQLYNTSEREAQQKYNTLEREAQQGWQSGENALARAFQTSEREAQQGYNTSEREAAQAYSTSEREAQQAYSTSEREAQQAYNTSERLAQQDFNAAQAALDRAQNQGQFEAQLNFNREEAARDQSNRDIAQAFAEKQWEDQQAQWREEFDYNKMSDDQKLAYNYAVAILGNGGDPSDELLARAGLSRADANAMKAKAKSSGGPGNDKPINDDRSNGVNLADMRLRDELNALEYGTGVIQNGPLAKTDFHPEKEIKSRIHGLIRDEIK